MKNEDYYIEFFAKNNILIYTDVKHNFDITNILVGKVIHRIPEERYLVGERVSFHKDRSRKLELHEYIAYKLTGKINEETTKSEEK